MKQKLLDLLKFIFISVLEIIVLISLHFLYDYSQTNMSATIKSSYQVAGKCIIIFLAIMFVAIDVDLLVQNHRYKKEIKENQK